MTENEPQTRAESALQRAQTQNSLHQSEFAEMIRAEGFKEGYEEGRIETALKLCLIMLFMRAGNRGGAGADHGV